MISRNAVSFCADESSQKIRAEHRCPARMGRENLFRGSLFCDCCGHPLTLSRKKRKDREVHIYLCTRHNRHPDECPKTHIIYHEVLCPYILEQIRTLQRSISEGARAETRVLAGDSEALIKISEKPLTY